jgi:transcription elongation factor GreA
LRELIDRLAAELKSLEHELRVQLPLEIRSAVAMGDLRENAEYHAALERQSFVKARIGQLRESLAVLNSVSLDQLPRDRVGLGSAVVLRDLDTDEELRYELVIPELAKRRG